MFIHTTVHENISSLIFAPKYGICTLQYIVSSLYTSIIVCVAPTFAYLYRCRVAFNTIVTLIYSASTLCTLVLILPLIVVLPFSYLSPTENTLYHSIITSDADSIC
jgi:hypothetical protein